MKSGTTNLINLSNVTISLSEVIKAVREKELTKTDLESYRDQSAILLTELYEECADLEKDEALFMAGRANEESAISRKISWKGTPAGLRLIVVKRYISATKTMLDSLKSRLYLIY